jgi:hypothetical protein
MPYKVELDDGTWFEVPNHKTDGWNWSAYCEKRLLVVQVLGLLGLFNGMEVQPQNALHD